MANLAKLLTENVHGGTFISLKTDSTVKLNKTYKDEDGVKQSNPHHGKVTKVTKDMNVMVFQNKNSNAYENMVKRRLTEQGSDPETFTVGPRTWGTRIPNTCFIEHKGAYYVEVILISKGKTEYFLNDEPIAYENILGAPARKSNPEAQGGIEKKIDIRTFSVASIVGAKVSGEVYEELSFDINEVSDVINYAPKVESLVNDLTEGSEITPEAVKVIVSRLRDLDEMAKDLVTTYKAATDEEIEEADTRIFKRLVAMGYMKE